MFPEELPRRLIKMFSFVEETVLDPFAGSGTTSLAARNLDRNSIGYEINPEFIPTIKEKLEIDQLNLSDTTYDFIKSEEIPNDFEKEIQQLPYIFKDPHTLDKMIDIKKLQFGSKLDKNSSTQREELYTVKDIISPEKIRLNNDITIRLIGIKENPDITGEAVSFLIEKLKGKKVFLKYDNIKHDSENNLFCYLYLENKTFINAHLIKKGLANVDEIIDYKKKNKFLMLKTNHVK
jgi:site-specific DNA-methyltransferase (adenine-specific)